MPNEKVRRGDVSRDWLDRAVLGEERHRAICKYEKGIRERVGRMNQLEPQLIVGEATGGYEEALVLVSSHTGEAVAHSQVHWRSDRRHAVGGLA